MIDRVDYVYKEDGEHKYLKGSHDNASFFLIHKVHSHSVFNEMIQTKSYTLDDVVGTIGGFIGLFLGYALVQMPDFIDYLLFFLQNQILNFQGQRFKR